MFVEHRVFAPKTKNMSIVLIDSHDARSGRSIRISVPIFIDCSGIALFGQYSGAKTILGEESRAEYGEPLEPTEKNQVHHGNTVFSRTVMADSPALFSPVPWATEGAKDFANLRGQLVKPGIENGEGPSASSEGQIVHAAVRRRTTRLLTHFREYGQHLDPYTH